MSPEKITHANVIINCVIKLAIQYKLSACSIVLTFSEATVLKTLILCIVMILLAQNMQKRKSLTTCSISNTETSE